MNAFLEFVLGLLALVAAAALAQLGIDYEPRRSEPREIHRTNDCGERAQTVAAITNQDC